jgi:acyl-CoA synthetase (AMP-forming)/AMP-acid ligase II
MSSFLMTRDDGIATETLVQVVLERAATLGETACVRYMTSGDVSGPTVELTYGELARRAAAIAAMLQQQATVGDRALLLYPSGVDFVTAFFGCLFGGVIPVPAYPPDLAKPERALGKLRGIVADCGARFALTTAEFLPMLERVAPAVPELARLHTCATDTCDGALAAAWRAPDLSRETIALVQYTSGSTGAPKGAVLRHRQLIANKQSITAAMGAVGCVVGWLPVFHDMGLGNVLQVIYAGSSLVLMSPASFLKRPARWVEAISHFGATTSGGPNFAYDLCVRRTDAEERARLDLRSWQVAFCGAEPVRAATLERFAAAFAPAGFRRSSLLPCYGLAEATLFVAGNARGIPPKTCTVRASALDHGRVEPVADTADARTLVSCGMPSPTEDLRIVDPDRRVVVDGVGEIWVRGPGIASGYWGRGDDDRETFAARLADTGEGPFLRTGDLGFVRDGELYLAGRRKEMIILAGRNLFPQDIEATVEAAAPAVRKGCCVAFSVERDGAEQLVIVAEHAGPAQDSVRAIKQAVAEHHHAAVFEVVLVARGAIPKTSSGKLERYACRAAYLDGAPGGP